MTSTTDLERTGFILGIHRRSGTNYLYRLLTEHPDCDGIGPIGEDFMIHHSDILRHYVERVKEDWNVEWRAQTLDADGDLFCHFIGDGIVRLLRDQAGRNRDAQHAGLSHAETGNQLVVTKTPSVNGLSNVFDFFPHALLILLVRDGRAVVESGMRSFGWDFEKAVREWACGARRILAFRDRGFDPQRVLIVKYEDLVQSGAETLGTVLDFLGLDRRRYDFEQAARLGVIGSSELSKAGGIHWNDTPKPDAFDPLKRYADWGAARHRRFNWLAGREMARLGYEPQDVRPIPAWCRLGYRCRDAWWSVRALAPVIWTFLKQGPAKIRVVLLARTNQAEHEA